ncbi:hypothetical protein BGW41_002840 [Actinomortierella wolfii]|nr:hypothetical protein BGW41_002840 [Actinomortierella wolfii]
MTSTKPITTVKTLTTSTPAKVHSFVRQHPLSSSNQPTGESERDKEAIEHPNGRISVLPTSYDGGLLVGLYDPHLGPQCAEYLQQHLVPILDESLSTQLDHTDYDEGSQASSTSLSNQVLDSIRTTFLELDELLLATAMTLAVAKPQEADEATAEENRKAQEVVAQVVTGSTALVSFLVPQRRGGAKHDDGAAEEEKKLDLYLAQLGDSVAILAGLDEQGEWTARRLNPPETHEHSVRYPGSQEYEKVISEVKKRAQTAEQYLNARQPPQQQQSPNSTAQPTQQRYQQHVQNDMIEEVKIQETFLTRHGHFLGLPVTRAFGDLDWKTEQEPRLSIAQWVEPHLRERIDHVLGVGEEEDDLELDLHTDAKERELRLRINNLMDPPYVSAEPRVTRFELTTGSSAHQQQQKRDHFLILLNRAMLYSVDDPVVESLAISNSAKLSRSNHLRLNNLHVSSHHREQLLSDLELSHIVQQAIASQRTENPALAIAEALDKARRAKTATNGAGPSNGEILLPEELEGSVVVIEL